MLGMDISRAKRLFFDKAVVRNAASKAERNVLSKFGAFVRTGARSSIRKRRKPSKPGTPPSSHTGLLKRFIFFAYDPTRRSVVIGPARLSEKLGTAPAALEYGGTTRVAAGRKKQRPRTVTIRPRPFMNPAFAREQSRLPALWKNSVK